jgi:hypothetical protein
MSVIDTNDCPSKIVKKIVDLLPAMVADIMAEAAYEAAWITVMRGNYLKGMAGLAGVAVSLVAVSSAAFYFMIAGKEYIKAALPSGTALAAGTVPASTYGAYRFEIGVDGTVDCIAATANATTGYASAPLALAGIPALQASHLSMGTLVVINTTAGGFVAGTTKFTDAGVTATFTDATTLANSLPAGITQTSTSFTLKG